MKTRSGGATQIPLTAPLLAFLLCAPVARAQPGCYQSSVLSPAPLLGNHGEIVQLADGTLWEVIGAYLYLYKYYPIIVACPTAGKLIVGQDSVNARLIRPPDPLPPASSGPTTSQGVQTAKPSPRAAVIDSQINGEFTGWDGDTVFRLMNGQIWQQASYSYTYYYAFMPKVLIFKDGDTYQMQVEGVQERIAVRQLR